MGVKPELAFECAGKCTAARAKCWRRNEASLR
jgi:hypothetical protein